ncbi:MAG: phosphatase PAP2 family protein [Streptosporangiaceae bacterium]
MLAHAADNGFPSGHATLTMFLAVCVLFYSRRWGSLLAVSALRAVSALMVGGARVLARVHSPAESRPGRLAGPRH